jgi:purine-nucleoside phosphorylase
MTEVVRPVRVLAELGIETLILTNASGSVNPAFRPGDIMVIRDHLNLMGMNPLRGEPRFVDLSAVYDGPLSRSALKAARRLRIPVRTGVYAAVSGPSYETPAEVRMLRALGADAVGMSTVPEAIAAREGGLKILGLSVIANPGAGLSRTPLSHAEVLRATGRARNGLERLLREMVAHLARSPAANLPGARRAKAPSPQARSSRGRPS